MRSERLQGLGTSDLPVFQLKRSTDTRDSQLIARSSSKRQTSILPNYFVEPENRRHSKQVARAVFLRIIASVRPHVIDDLWPIFWLYLFDICDRFHNKLHIDGRMNGESVYQAVLERECQDPDKWLFIMNSPPRNRVWRLQYWGLEAIHKLDCVAVNRTFPRWSALQHGGVRSAVERWSIRWNLNADWCREFGFAIIKICLFHEGIQASFLHPHKPKLNPYLAPPLAQTILWHKDGSHAIGKANDWLSRIWVNTALKPLGDEWSIDEEFRELWPLSMGESREVLKAIVFEGNEPSKFSYKDFRMKGWNFLEESSALFRDKAKAAFRLHLLEREHAYLTAFQANLRANRRPTQPRKATRLISGNLKAFNRRLDDYLVRMGHAKDIKTKKHKLIDVPDKTKLLQHLRYAVLYQVPDKRESTSTLRVIAQKAGLKEPGVFKAIKECLGLLELEKRTTMRGGRKAGSKNSETSRILRTLGH
jgi:hypothetical protein